MKELIETLHNNSDAGDWYSEAALAIEKLEATNKELLEALQSFMQGAEAMGWSTDKARAAIARVTKGKSK